MQMWWAVCCVAVVVGSVYADAAPASSELSHSIDWTQLEPAPDDESIEYALSPGGRYPSAPWLYLLADVPRDSQEEVGRIKRRMPSLSIDLPMSVLRNKLSLEKDRKIHALRAAANRDFLNDIGKRGFLWSSAVNTDTY
ncbi:diuretic hormone 1 isoform X3 [Zerene cesonia]|uniref:diuretic hormone 1 isoform X3 n=1 Tax=Zerene cesonia TaxID=33412 RepID=UPI0018E503A0|nr:diuretic hormone 1 isoform X3 [Zerene cesonia]